MATGPAAVREVSGVDPGALPSWLLAATEPVLVRGLVAGWPVVRAAIDGRLDAYLGRYYRDATVDAWFGPPGIAGRFGYDESFTGFNFSRERARLDTVLQALARHHGDARPPAIYVGSTTVDTCLPGLRQDNDLGFGELQPLMSLWLGNRSCIAAHQDLPDNLACVAAGRRRFTLFAPEELPNLYVGPIDFTPAGQPVSLVDVTQPDLRRFPRFAGALQRARVAELGPGDALFIPSMWWHHVQALEPLNLLLNYWWRCTPGFMDAPVAALMTAILSVRDLPPAQRRAWQRQFEHYVFDAGEHTAAHIPEPARGVLKPLDADAARQLRARLLQRLNR